MIVPGTLQICIICKLLNASLRPNFDLEKERKKRKKKSNEYVGLQSENWLALQNWNMEYAIEEYYCELGFLYVMKITYIFKGCERYYYV